MALPVLTARKVFANRVMKRTIIIKGAWCAIFSPVSFISFESMRLNWSSSYNTTVQNQINSVKAKFSLIKPTSNT